MILIYRQHQSYDPHESQIEFKNNHESTKHELVTGIIILFKGSWKKTGEVTNH